jgi:hypothetical protein
MDKPPKVNGVTFMLLGNVGVFRAQIAVFGKQKVKLVSAREFSVIELISKKEIKIMNKQNVIQYLRRAFFALAIIGSCNVLSAATLHA